MPLLRGLNKDEQRALFHKIQNSNRREGDTFLNDGLLDEFVNRNIETKLSEISEDANFQNKNRYRLQRTLIDYADKKRMPVDESKLKDILRNHTAVRHRMDKEIGTYSDKQKNTQYEQGVLTYLNEVTYGEMRDLVRDVGINNDSVNFYSVNDL